MKKTIRIEQRRVMHLEATIEVPDDLDSAAGVGEVATSDDLLRAFGREAYTERPGAFRCVAVTTGDYDVSVADPQPESDTEAAVLSYLLASWQPRCRCGAPYVERADGTCVWCRGEVRVVQDAAEWLDATGDSDTYACDGCATEVHASDLSSRNLCPPCEAQARRRAVGAIRDILKRAQAAKGGAQ